MQQLVAFINGKKLFLHIFEVVSLEYLREDDIPGLESFQTFLAHFQSVDNQMLALPVNTTDVKASQSLYIPKVWGLNI